MEKTFRKTHREFSEQIFKNAEQQSGHGILGNEFSWEIIVDKYGRQESIKCEFTGLKVGSDGIPVVYKVRAGVLLDCGHKVNSIDDVLGRCKYGHMVCTKCELYTCSICGEKVCDMDMDQLNDNTIVCKDHDTALVLESIKSVISSTLFGLCGVSDEVSDDDC